MKKILSLLLIAITLITAAGCGGGGAEDVVLVPDDVLSPVAIYSMASNIVMNPAEYAGKTVRAEGECLYNTDSSTGYYIRISDSTACCYEDIEFSIADGVTVPEDSTVFQLVGKITTFKDGSGRERPRFEATEFVYEEELREIYADENF